MNNLADLVDRLAKSVVLAQSVEEATRQAAVLPVLDALGWDWRNLDEVVPEYGVSGGRVDYCLRAAGRAQVLVEVKRTGTDLDGHQQQLLRYAFEEGTPLAVLTDGLVWWLYLPTETGSWEQRKFFTIDFRRQSSDVAARSLSRFLTKSAVVDGQAIEEARAEHSGQERDRRVREGFPIAWRQLLAGPDELLSELLAEAVAGVSGHRPRSEQVAQFLADFDSPTKNEPMPTRADVTETPQSGPPSKQEDSERHRIRREYHTALLEHASTRTTLQADRTPSKGQYQDAISGHTGIYLSYGVSQHGTFVHLWIDRGTDRVDWNDTVYRYLMAQKEKIEVDFGEALTWSAKETNRSRKIVGSLELGGYADREAWPDVIEATVEMMIRFDASIRPHLGEAVKAADVEHLPDSFIGRRPIAFTFQGERHPVETWRDILTGLSEIAAMHVGERFAEVVQPIRGRKRSYFAKASDELVAPLPILGGKMFIEGNLNANDCVHIARRVAAAAFGDEAELTVEHSLRD